MMSALLIFSLMIIAISVILIVLAPRIIRYMSSLVNIEVKIRKE